MIKAYLFKKYRGEVFVMRERNHKKVAAGTETKEDRKELSTRNELEVSDCTIERSCKEYYIEPVKIIRDLVHGYINLTSFELKLIDSTPLQRLKDIRQLTCQQVYPSARHTRFEHSLGVMELTRRAIDSLNHNNYINKQNKKISENKIISDRLKFNIVLAALLHDVGHCPFSHLGEQQMDKMEVWNRLRSDIHNVIPGSSLDQVYQSPKYDNYPEKSAIHEQISCILILEYYKKFFDAESDKMRRCNLSIDYEYILRCIMGVEYKFSGSGDFLEMNLYNSLIGLINSNIFDMDKLDYIMRDSQFTGIGTPIVDTQRLFKNMFLWDDNSIVFSSKAIPVLQNMIEARDDLYMYVYNHHTAVFSDFMYSYILRRLDHNARDLYKMMYDNLNTSNLVNIAEVNDYYIKSKGFLFKQSLFSLRVLLRTNISDSDLISTINLIYSESNNNKNYTNLQSIIRNLVGYEKNKTILSNNSLYPSGAVTRGRNFRLSCSDDVGSHLISVFALWKDPDDTQIERLSSQLKRTHDLINKLQSRIFLTPWWKTIFEYNLFMNANFIDDSLRKNLARLICNGSGSLVSASEFRSQIAKHVRYIMQNLYVKGHVCAKLEDNDFFVVERPVKFFDITTINNISIALRPNQIIGMVSSDERSNDTQVFYRKFLSDLIPQKDYFSYYGEHSFYIYSRNFSKEEGSRYSEDQLHKFNTTVQQVFVFVAKEMVSRGEQDFALRFSSYNAVKEEGSMEEMFSKFYPI